jgi:hypothetical protein
VSSVRQEHTTANHTLISVKGGEFQEATMHTVALGSNDNGTVSQVGNMTSFNSSRSVTRIYGTSI